MTESKISLTPTEEPSTKRITFIVKRLIDVFWYLMLASSILLVFVTFIVGLNIPEEPAARHTDIDFYLQFEVYPEAISEMKKLTDSPSELIRGRGDLKLNNTRSHLAWYTSKFIQMILIIFSLFAIKNLQKLFTNLTTNKVFNSDNHIYIRRFGILVTIMSVIYPLLTYLGGLYIIDDVGVHADNILLGPAFYLNFEGILMGLAIIILAAVMEEACQIHEEQELTI